jgi:hypothetical protein
MKILQLKRAFCSTWLRMLIPFIFIVFIVFGACKKESSNGSAASQQEEFANVTSQSDAEAEVTFDDVFDNVMGVNNEVGIGGTGVFGRIVETSAGPSSNDNKVAGMDSLPPCFTVTIIQISTANRFPLKAIIDFGTGCTGRDGRTRKGKIIVTYSGRMILPGSSASTTFDGYYINDTKVEGTHTVTNSSTQTVKSFTIDVTNAKLTHSDGSFLQWNSSETISQTDGVLTPIPVDDVFNLSGHTNGLVQKDNKLFEWSTAITSPLVKRFSCHWIVKGTVNIQKGNAAIAVLDYGTGDCDSKASFTVNGVVHEITLH